MARFFPFFPPRPANFRPQRRRSLSQPLAPFVVRADAFTQRLDPGEQRFRCDLQLWTQPFRFLGIHIAHVAPAQPFPVGLSQLPCSPARSALHQSGSCPDHRQVRLRLRAAMLHRTQQLRVDPGLNLNRFCDITPPFGSRKMEVVMTLAEDLRKKYALTSLKLDGNCLALMAINEALEAAAQIADQGNAVDVASRIRSLKWANVQINPAQPDQDLQDAA
jgi:hypothetical protein